MRDYAFCRNGQVTPAQGNPYITRGVSSSILAVTLTMILVSAIACSLSTLQKAPVQIPDVGRVLRMALGYSTVEEFEKRLGPGKPSIGGHPNGRRTWFDPRNQTIISLDGFEYARNGRLVDEVEIRLCTEMRSDLPKVPQTITLDRYALCGGAFRLGMARAEATQAAKTRGWTYITTSEGLQLNAKGRVDFRGAASYDHLVYSRWSAELRFVKDRLAELDFSAEYDN